MSISKSLPYVLQMLLFKHFFHVKKLFFLSNSSQSFNQKAPHYEEDDNYLDTIGLIYGSGVDSDFELEYYDADVARLLKLKFYKKFDFWKTLIEHLVLFILIIYSI